MTPIHGAIVFRESVTMGGRGRGGWPPYSSLLAGCDHVCDAHVVRGARKLLPALHALSTPQADSITDSSPPIMSFSSLTAVVWRRPT
ncbi:hypothetical protein E2C01_015444 [Portunus trituberculatus]|uniref:Uncharacterized protein n=1 Tax=Portunus trituberculatus TaxID=210409 RepID=A0A5B7DLP0_PORTR|nr:hypothetical protein [Portunus trituberculatus]